MLFLRLFLIRNPTPPPSLPFLFFPIQVYPFGQGYNIRVHLGNYISQAGEFTFNSTGIDNDDFQYIAGFLFPLTSSNFCVFTSIITGTNFIHFFCVSKFLMICRMVAWIKSCNCWFTSMLGTAGVGALIPNGAAVLHVTEVEGLLFINVAVLGFIGVIE